PLRIGLCRALPSPCCCLAGLLGLLPLPPSDPLRSLLRLEEQPGGFLEDHDGASKRPFRNGSLPIGDPGLSGLPDVGCSLRGPERKSRLSALKSVVGRGPRIVLTKLLLLSRRLEDAIRDGCRVVRVRGFFLVSARRRRVRFGSLRLGLGPEAGRIDRRRAA